MTSPDLPTSVPAPTIDWSAIERLPAYRQLVRERSRFAWTLTAIMLAIYFGYILLVAFAPATLALPLGDSSTTVGIPLGLGVILVGILLTGIYVRRANRRFDTLTLAIVKECGA